MRETDARKEEHQADGKEGGCQQTPPDGDDARLGMHGSDLVFFQTFFFFFFSYAYDAVLHSQREAYHKLLS